MSDEKWWFGLIARTFAKMCPELGIEKKSFHESHIHKVGPYPSNSLCHCTCSKALPSHKQMMGHATVGYLFYDTPENGGMSSAESGVSYAGKKYLFFFEFWMKCHKYVINLYMITLKYRKMSYTNMY